MSNQVVGFYDEYFGHNLEQLETVHNYFRQAKTGNGVIWLAGDSSLDNKHWFADKAPAVNGYEKILKPPTSKKDVTYWINYLAQQRDLPYTAINCALEESTVQARACGRLLPHDEFVRDHVQPEDVVVVSVGGNDIALKPVPCTILNTLALVCCSTSACIESCSCGCALPCDDCCGGCTMGCLSAFCAWPFGMGYMIHLFKVRIQSYLQTLLSGKFRPKQLLICMIYYLDEKQTGGWADPVLAALGYNTNPGKLQSVIRRIFELATREIEVPGTEVIAVPLFAALDGTCTEDYCERVEPSAKGGAKMAELILDAVGPEGNEHMESLWSKIKVDHPFRFKTDKSL
eukprot:Colp12_sorted_trinity150504_noHs@32369